MNILTENGQILNFNHYRLLEVQQRIRHGVTRFEITAHHATLPRTETVRTVNEKEFAEDIVADFYAAIKAKRTVWDATDYQPKPPKPKDEPSSESDETDAAADVPPQTV